MRPIDIACRATNKDGTNCGAQAGEKCKWPYPWAEQMGFHSERIEDASASSVSADPPSAAAFEKAVEAVRHF